MTRIKDDEIIKAFIESEAPAKDAISKAIINHFGREIFVEQAKLIAIKGWSVINGVHANQHNFCQEVDRIQFYKAYRHDFLAQFEKISGGNTAWFLSMLFHGEASDKEINTVIILNDDEHENYRRLVDFFMIHEIEGLCQSFFKFTKEYKEQNQFLDIDVGIDENLTVDAKQLLLLNLPNFHVMKDGSIRDNNGVTYTPSKTLEDILNLIRADGYKEGYAASNISCYNDC